MCLDRFPKRVSLERATEASQSEDGYDPADLGHGAGLEEEQAADEFLVELA